MSSPMPILEQFDLSSKPRVRQLSADSAELKEMLEDARHTGYAAGFAEGKEAADTELAQAAMALASQISQLVPALDDEREVLRAEFGKAFEATIHAVLPPLAERAFPKLVLRTLQEYLAEHRGGLTLRATPELCRMLRPVLEGLEKAKRIRVIETPKGPPLKAEIGWDHGLCALDLGAACAKALDLLKDPAAGGAPKKAAPRRDKEPQS